MKAIQVLAGACLVASSVGMGASAQPLVDPRTTPFPYALPHEVQIIDGVPCRTLYDPATRLRIPVACAESPVSTGSVAPRPGPPLRAGAAPVLPPPGSFFPYSAPHEIRSIDGVPCRTVLDPSSNTRVPVECAYR